MPFTCPLPDCNTYIARAGEWSVHAAEHHSGEWLKGSLTAALPEPLALTFKRRREALGVMKDNIYRQHDKLYEHWHTQGERKREEIQQTWIDQLTNDPTWDTREKAEESRLYTQFLQHMYPEGSSAH
jgi:hypothetical protein